jgi:hypothetical protein
MEIEKFITLSTGHLPYKEFVKLDTKVSKEFEGVYVDKFEFGRYVRIDVTEYEFVGDEVFAHMAALKKILDKYTAIDVTLIVFDQDGSVDPDLPVYEWPSRPRYNSAADVAFQVLHVEEEPTAEELLEGLRIRLKNLEKNPAEIKEACDVFDTMDNEENGE